MYFEDDYMYEVEGTSRRGRKLFCECERVGGERDRDRDRDRNHDHDCGCRRERGESRRDRDHGCGCERGEEMERRSHCKGCACEQLRDLARNTLVLFSTGDAIQLLPALFISFDRRTCCATLRIGSADVYVDCRDIKVLLIP